MLHGTGPSLFLGIVFKQVEALTFELGVSRDAPVIDFEELPKSPVGITNLINDVERLRYSGEEATRRAAAAASSRSGPLPRCRGR